MKTHLIIAAILTTSLVTTNLVMAHPGGGVDLHTGGGTHFSAPAFAGHFHRQEDHRSAPEWHHFDRNHDGHRREFWGGYWPYYGGWEDTIPEDNGLNSAVAAVQDALARQGYYRGPVDGYLDLATQDAIAKYESANRLPVTREIDQSLLNSLGLE